MGRWPIVVLVLALALAGCGSKKTTAIITTSTTSSSTSSSSSTTTTTTTTSSSSSSGSSSKPSFASAKNCAQLESLASKIAASAGPSKDAATSLQNEENVFNALEAAAPSEIKGDFKTFADAFKSFAEAYSSAGITAGQVPSAQQLLKLQTASKALSAPKLRTAEAHLQAWAQTNCGLKP